VNNTLNAFRQSEIRAVNDAASSAAVDVRSGFRQREIQELNADADDGKGAMWGLLGLGGVLVLSLMMKSSRRK